MGDKKFLWFLAGEAVFFLAFYGAASAAGWVVSAMAFPFAPVGQGLRWLSLSGGVGNAVAVLLYAALSLAPLAGLWALKRRRVLCLEDGLLGLLSPLLFGVLYYMVNPSSLPGIAGEAGVGREVSFSLLGGTVYALLLCYLLLRALRHFLQADRERLQGYLGWLLRALAVLFVYLVAGLLFQECLTAFSGARPDEQLLWCIEGEVMAGQVSVDQIFSLLRYLAAALPYLLDVAIVLAALHLLGAMKTDRYSQETMAAAGRLSRLCAKALGLTLLVTLAMNLLQLLFLGSLSQVHIALVFPLLSVAFLLAVLLMARLLEENRALKRDNDLFV